MAENLMDQSEIEKLLSQDSGVTAPAAKPAAASPGQATIESPMPSPAAKSSAAAPSDSEKDRLLGQNDIENLLNQAGKAPLVPPSKPQAEISEPNAGSRSNIAERDIEFLLNQAEQALESIDSAGGGDLPQGIREFHFEELHGAPASTESATLDLIRDVELDLKIELGRTQMYLEDVLKLRRGSVVPLDKLAGDPVDIYVNGRLVARGEVLVMNDNFCVRVAELIAGGNVCA
jgi:flagellar motor switch protein FliN